MTLNMMLFITQVWVVMVLCDGLMTAEIEVTLMVSNNTEEWRNPKANHGKCCLSCICTF